MTVLKSEPVRILLCGFILVIFSGCSSIKLQSKKLLDNKPSEFIKAQELTRVNFNPQREYECGPASLATLLQWQNLDITDTKLVSEIYIPNIKGSLQVEMLATTRRYNLIPYVIEKKMTALMEEIKAGNPVLVLQNLGLESYPLWHYAVVIGYDLNKNQIILRSGEIERHVNSFSLFERTWHRANYWGFIVLPKDKLPASGNAFDYLKSVAPFENLKKFDFALGAYKSALQRWPNDKHLLMAAGNASYLSADLVGAKKFYQKVVSSWPFYAPALNNLAQIFYDNKDFLKAEELISRAINLNDKHQKTYKETLETIRER